MTVPNIITLGRIICVPIIIWLILSGAYLAAFGIFVFAGISDALDGWIAKNFNAASQLGALLDPIADKALLVSIYVTLGLQEALASWLVILVVSRDILIIGAVLLSMLIGHRLVMAPLMISKVNTTFQIVLAACVLGALAFGFVWSDVLVEAGGSTLFIGDGVFALSVLVAVTTVWSGGSYFRVWTQSVTESDI